jgi:hypothetical protein
LGGIVVIKGEDFERINGYPNYWSWGNEDNVLQYRVENNGLFIDRSQFYEIGSPQMLQLFDGISRIINKQDFIRRNTDKGIDGLSTLYAINYTIDNKSSNINDNIHKVFTSSDKRFIINIHHFIVPVNHEKEDYFDYDLREPVKKITHPDESKRIHTFNNNNWTRIPKHKPVNVIRRIGMGGLK